IQTRAIIVVWPKKTGFMTGLKNGVTLSITPYWLEGTMRTTKVVTFSVPPEFEIRIQEHARLEHRTVSEYLREAVRQYMDLSKFEVARSGQRRGKTPSRSPKASRKARK